MSGVEGKVIVITGASSGIGEATAVLLAERGAKLVLGARGEDRLAALAKRIGDLRVDEWDQMIDVNLKGVMYGIAAALPVSRAQGSGHFINTASIAAHKTVAGQTIYSASKTAVRALSEGLRQEAGEAIASPSIRRASCVPP